MSDRRRYHLVMPADDPYEDDADDAGPPDPMDRLWRHPSEMGTASAAATPASPLVSTSPTPATARWISLFGASAGGAVLTVIVLAAFGLVGSTGTADRAAAPLKFGDRPSTHTAVDAITPSLAKITVTTPAGASTFSAVCIGKGLLVTSAHALGGAAEVVVKRADGRSAAAPVLAVDPVTDLAVIDASDNPSAVSATALDPKVGDDTVVVAAPVDGSPWVTTAVVSSVDTLMSQPANRTVAGLIEINTDIPTRAVGAPIVDGNGAVLGLLIGTVDGRARAVPISTVRRVAELLATEGRVEHAWLGVTADDAQGARVTTVDPASPAAGAGLVVGDVITEYDSRPISSVASLAAETLRRRPGDDVMLTVENGDYSRSVTVALGLRPDGPSLDGATPVDAVSTDTNG